MENKKYDFVIVGSGFGGLLCAYFLAEKGFDVCILEKNRQFGGVLQIFSRGKRVFDTGVHYVGGLEPGQNLYKMFNYMGLFPDLQIQKLDPNGFDVMMFEDDPIQYKYAQGWIAFENQLVGYFPEEEKAIRTYCDKLAKIVDDYKFYNLESVPETIDLPESLWVDTATYIESLTSNPKLQAVLGGTNLLYAGKKNTSPLYVHALIIHSYVQSAYKIIGGGGALEKLITKRLKKMNVEMRNYCEVVKFVNDGEGNASHVLLKDGEKVFAKNFISNIHPAYTISMMDDFSIRKSYLNKFKRLKNTDSCFAVNLSIEDGIIPYEKHNFYYFNDLKVWEGCDYTEDTWPKSFALYTNESRKNPGFTESAILLAYMKYEDVKKWEETFRVIPNNDISRGEEYEDFKKEKAQKLIDFASEKFPWMKEHVYNVDCSTPLTYRDYVNTPDGTLYGVLKDHNDPLSSFLAPKTKVPNVFLTGQSLNLHGIVGVALSSLITCGCFLDIHELLNKFNALDQESQN